MSQDPWLNERFVGGSRLDQESARQAQEAARALGQDYVSGQLADSRRVGERAVQEASQRLATEAAIRSNMQVSGTNQSATGTAVSHTPATPALTKPKVAEINIGTEVVWPEYSW